LLAALILVVTLAVILVVGLVMALVLAMSVFRVVSNAFVVVVEFCDFADEGFEFEFFKKADDFV